MSTTERQQERLAASLESMPRFDLDFGVDDPNDPTEVTIYDPLAEDVTTSWLTVDVDAAVDLVDAA